MGPARVCKMQFWESSQLNTRPHPTHRTSPQKRPYPTRRVTAGVHRRESILASCRTFARALHALEEQKGGGRGVGASGAKHLLRC